MQEGHLPIDPSNPLRIGARGSPLSLAQTGGLRALLGAALGLDERDIPLALPIIAIVTTGDRIQDRTLMEAGGKGLFTKELDDALLDGRVDCAVHSMKDVPTHLPEGIGLLAMPTREDARDALMTLDGRPLAGLAPGAHVGTASLRRGAQLRHARPDLRISTLRGNVGTRLAKLADGSFDATVLAMAGLARLGLADRPHWPLDPIAMPPAIGQGALAVTGRTGDARVAAAFARVGDPATTRAVTAERAMLAALDGSCRTAIGAWSVLEDGTLTMIGEALAPDGSRRFRAEGKSARAAEDADLGRALARAIRAEAGDDLRFEG
jgi:hydroxymethylbilane synthase